MLVYRITHKKWANSLQASGFAGRWNSQGIFVLYTSESMALACLENLVHRNGIGLHGLYEVMHIELPTSLKLKSIPASNLPKGWDDLTEKGNTICRKIGDAWVKEQSSCLLKVPSVIISTESNVLINCMHQDFKKIKIKTHHPFLFDQRL